MKIYDDYLASYTKFIGESPLNNYNKISGNIFSQTLRKYISKILAGKYKVSVVNAYIKGSEREWDLLILKNDVSKEEETYNVYNSENVVAAVEFKTSGIFTSNISLALKYLNDREDELKEIKFIYISLCEKPETLKAMKKKHNCFWLIEDYYRNRYKRETIRNDYKELEEFLNKLVKESVFN